MGYAWKRREIHYMVSVGTSEGKKHIGVQRRRWDDNIKMHIKETEWKRVEWVILTQDTDNKLALVKTAVSIWVRQNAKFLTS
jgi:hypothetical protein